MNNGLIAKWLWQQQEMDDKDEKSANREEPYFRVYSKKSSDDNLTVMYINVFDNLRQLM